MPNSNKNTLLKIFLLLLSTTYFYGCLPGAINLNNFADENLKTCVAEQRVVFIKDLTQLNCSNKNIKQLNGIEQLIYIEHLDLSNNLISQTSNLNALIELTHLNLKNNYIRGDLDIAGIHKLKHLDLEKNNIQNIDKLNQSLPLEFLSLSYHLGENEIATLLASLNKLKHFHTIETDQYSCDDIKSYLASYTSANITCGVINKLFITSPKDGDKNISRAFSIQVENTQPDEDITYAYALSGIHANPISSLFSTIYQQGNLSENGSITIDLSHLGDAIIGADLMLFVTAHDASNNKYIGREVSYFTIEGDALVKRLAKEKAALFDFYRALNGQNWQQNHIYNISDPKRKWLPENHVKDFAGIIVDNLGYVSAIILGQSNLVGEIPSSINHFHYLTRIDLFNNPLGGEIPKEIGDLKYLQQLHLHIIRGSNIPGNLTGTIPVELNKLKHLNQPILLDGHPSLTGRLSDLGCDYVQSTINIGISGTSIVDDCL